MIRTERPGSYKKKAPTKLPPDNSLHSATSITTSSLHAASEVSQLNGKVMIEKTSKFTFYRLKGYHSPKKGERKQVADNDAKENKGSNIGTQSQEKSTNFSTSSLKKGAQQQTDISTIMSQASDLSALEITKKIGEKKTGSERKGNSSNDKKRGSKLNKKIDS